MPSDPDGRSPERPVGRAAVEGRATVLLGSGLSLAVTGALAVAVGPSVSEGAIGLPAPAALVLLASGAALSAIGLSLGGRGWAGITRRYAPRLYPGGSVAIQIAIFAAGVIGSVAVYQGIVDDFSNAQPVSAPAGSMAAAQGDGLLVGATLLVWLLAAAVALGLRRAFSMARSAELFHGEDPYLPDTSVVRSTVVPAHRPGGSAPPDRPYVLFSLTIVPAFSASAAIQMLQYSVAPVPLGAWLSSLLLLPFWVIGVAATLRAADRAVGELEERYRAAGSPPPEGPPAPGGPTAPPTAVESL